jgi:hypothetical protein
MKKVRKILAWLGIVSAPTNVVIVSETVHGASSHVDSSGLTVIDLAKIEQFGEIAPHLHSAQVWSDMHKIVNDHFGIRYAELFQKYGHSFTQWYNKQLHNCTFNLLLKSNGPVEYYTSTWGPHRPEFVTVHVDQPNDLHRIGSIIHAIGSEHEVITTYKLVYTGRYEWSISRVYAIVPRISGFHAPGQN